MTTNFDYYSYQVATTVEVINEEIEFYKSLEESRIPGIVSDYYNYLVSRVTDEYVYPESKDTKYVPIKKMNMVDYNHEMDIMVFRKPWNKLRPFHKTLKLKEYVENLKYGKDIDKEKIKKNRDKISDQLIKGFNEKKFNKNKNEIDYDPEKMIIKNIACIEKNKGLYKIDWE